MEDDIRLKINLYTSHLYTRWTSASRNVNHFKSVYQNWLKMELIPEIMDELEEDGEPEVVGTAQHELL